MEVAVKQAVARRELRILVMKREEEAAVAIPKHEEEIMEAVRNRDAEVDAVCVQREELIKEEVDERIQWVLAQGGRIEGGGNTVRGGRERVRGECEEGPATERSDHDKGERFVTVSYSSLHSAHGFKISL